MNTKKTRNSQERVEKIKRELLTLGPLRPGSLSQQWNVCGKPGCRCKDPKEPRKHGPYYQLSYTWRGKSHTSFVPADQLPEIKTQMSTYSRFRKLCQQWVDVELRQHAKTKRPKTRSAKPK